MSGLTQKGPYVWLGYKHKPPLKVTATFTELLTIRPSNLTYKINFLRSQFKKIDNFNHLKSLVNKNNLNPFIVLISIKSHGKLRKTLNAKSYEV